MTRQAMEKAYEQLPPGNARMLSEAKPYLDDIADEIEEDIIGIICAIPHARGCSALVITPTKIIEVTTGGATDVLPYSEVTSIEAVGGAKKFFGGHEQIFLRIGSISGMQTYPVSGEYEYNSHLGNEAESVFRKYRLRNT